MCLSLTRTHIHCNILFTELIHWSPCPRYFFNIFFTELIHWSPCPRYFLSQVQCSGSTSGDGVGQPKGPWPFPPEYIIQKTRLHSSRMHTARMFTVSPSMLCTGGEGACSWGVSQHALQQTPPMNRMTNRCKNITLPQTSFAGGKKLTAENGHKKFSSLVCPNRVYAFWICYLATGWSGEGTETG